MAAACLSHDDRLTEAARWCPADLTAARALATAERSTTAPVDGCCTGAGHAAEI